MNWENTDFSFEEEKETASSQNRTSTEAMSTEEEDDKAIQLRKFENPAMDPQRQTYIAIVNRFGELLINGQTQEIADTLLTEDCHSFLFNFNNGAPTTYAIGNQGFLTLHKGCVIIERKVRKTHVDVTKDAVFQVCECKILGTDGTVTDQVSMDFFTIQDLKIVRYRAAFGAKTEAHGSEDLFEPTNKEIMLAKVKELNYAFADKPDLEKVASLLHEKTEYKMWDYDGEKCHTLRKHDFVEGWRNLEEHYTLKTIVPYEVYSERQFIIGTYVYYLESKAEPGKELVWLSTSVYSFDRDLNIIQVTQQGELYPSDDVEIPFQVYSRQRFENKVREIAQHIKTGIDVFYTLDIDFACKVSKFGPLKNPFMGSYHGLKQVERFKNHVCNGKENIEMCKAPEFFIDNHDSSYDTIIILACSEGLVEDEAYEYYGRKMNFFSMVRFSFENGKLARMEKYFCEIPEPIPSPFDNEEFESVNILPRNYII